MHVRQRLVVLMMSLALMGGGARVGMAAERTTDDTIQQAFGKSHSVMKEQRRRLQNILDGFLSSDTAAIQQNAAELAQAMQQIMTYYPPESEHETQQWDAIAEIIKDAARLKTLTAAGKYQQAHTQYAALIGRCVACHQARRTWGRFPEPQQPLAKEGTAPSQAAPAASQSQSPSADQP